MSARVLVAASILLVSLGACAVAGAAGGSQQTATLVGEGAHTGSASEDEGVWYRVAVPEGKVLRVAYTRVSGDPWNDLVLVNSEGSEVAWTGSGSTAAYDPDEASAWIRVETFWGPVAYSFDVSFADAPAQDDAGSGRDAGQRRATALPVQPGRVSGRLLVADGDVADWYRVDAPAGTLLDVHSATGSAVDLVAPDGARIATVTHYDSSYDPRSYTVVSDGRPLFLRVAYYAVDHSFVVDASRPADVRVEGVEVRRIEAETEAGPAGASLAREVLVTVANEGSGHTRRATLRVLATHEGAATGHRVVGERALDLAPGERATLVLPWDPTGQVGDFTIVAQVADEFEVDVEDNEGRARSWVVAGGTPMGLDLLNHEVRAGSATIRVEYGGDRAGVLTPAGFVGYERGALVLL